MDRQKWNARFAAHFLTLVDDEYENALALAGGDDSYYEQGTDPCDAAEQEAEALKAMQ